MRPEQRRLPRDRVVADRLFSALGALVAIGTGAVALAVLAHVVTGASAASIDLAGPELGAVGSAALGSLAVLGLALAFALPLALFVATHLHEHPRLRGALRFFFECAAGTPSILLGVGGYALFVVAAGLGTSLLAGALTTALLMLPVLVVGFHGVLSGSDPLEREAALALGVSRAYALRTITLRRVAPGLVSIVVVASAHALGAAAPLLLTASAAHVRGAPELDLPVTTLPTHLYYQVAEGRSLEDAYVTALALLALVVAASGVGLVARRVGRERR